MAQHHVLDRHTALKYEENKSVAKMGSLTIMLLLGL